MAATQESITKIEAAMKGTNKERDLSKGLKDLNDRLSEAVDVWTKISEKQPDNKLVNSILKDTNKIIKLSREATDKNIESQKKPNILISDIFKLLHKTDKEKKQLSKTASKELAVALGKLSTERVTAGSVPMRSLEQAYKRKAPGIVAAKYEEGPAKAALGEPAKVTTTTVLAMLAGTVGEGVKTVAKVLSPTSIAEKLMKLTTMGGDTVKADKGILGVPKAKTRLDISPTERLSKKDSIDTIVRGLRLYFGRVAAKQTFWKKGDLGGTGTGKRDEVEEKDKKEPSGIWKGIKDLFAPLVALGKVVSGVVKFFNVLGYGLAILGAWLIGDFLGTWLMKFKGVQEFTQKIADSLYNFFTVTLPATWGTTVQFFKDMGKGAWQAIKDFGGWIKKGATYTWQAIKDFGTMIKNFAKAPFKFIGEKAGGAIAKSKEIASAVKEKTVETVRSIGRFLGFKGSHQAGTDYIPETGLYELHKGEAVLPAKSVSLLKEPSTGPLTKSVIAPQEQAQSATREIVKLTKVMEKQTTKESITQVGMGMGGIEVTRIPDKVDDVLLVFATLGAI